MYRRRQVTTTSPCGLDVIALIQDKTSTISGDDARLKETQCNACLVKFDLMVMSCVGHFLAPGISSSLMKHLAAELQLLLPSHKVNK